MILGIRLIEESYDRTKDNLILGNGYIRESQPEVMIWFRWRLFNPADYTEGILG